MTLPVGDFLADELHDALGRSGMTTDQASVTEILISRSNADMAAINAAYERREFFACLFRLIIFKPLFKNVSLVYKTSLTSDINSATSFSERDLFITLAEVLEKWFLIIYLLFF